MDQHGRRLIKGQIGGWSICEILIAGNREYEVRTIGRQPEAETLSSCVANTIEYPNTWAEGILVEFTLANPLHLRGILLWVVDPPL